MTSKSDKFSKEELKDKIDDAKSEASKMKSPKDVKKFIDSNKSKISQISKKLKGEQKDAFDKIVKYVEDFGNSKAELNEAKDLNLKIICGLVSIIMWLIGLGPAWVVGAASPILGPILISAMKKIPGLKESKNVDESDISVYYDNLNVDQSELVKMLNKFVRFADDGSIRSDGRSNYWEEISWIPLMVAKYIVDMCPTKDDAEMAQKIIEIGKAYKA